MKPSLALLVPALCGLTLVGVGCGKKKADEGGITVDYQSVGSGQGKKLFLDGVVDFGASDAAMSPDEIKKAEDKEKTPKGVVLLPMTAGAVVLAYNLPEVKDLKLSRDAYTKIFLGKITRWNDDAIKKANPGVALPDKSIHVVVRQDSSGTTYVFSNHLAAVSPDFKSQIGVNTAPAWPTEFTKGKGNEGVTAQLKTTPGSIGYIEYGYAKSVSGDVGVALIENKAGEYVPYSVEAAQAGLSSAELPTDLIAWAPDPADKKAYPIVTYTWLLCYKTYENKKTAEAVKKLVNYCLDEGQKSSAGLGYVPLPDAVSKRVREVAATIGGEKDGSAVEKLKGAGASFPAPIYQKWFKDFKSAK
ncbi:MAG: phosphate ABC transporter substrate-binding protein PstS [Gemmataceae bacterium]